MYLSSEKSIRDIGLTWLGYVGLLTSAGMFSRVIAQDKVVEVVGSHAGRAVFEHALEASALPIAAMGFFMFFWDFDDKLFTAYNTKTVRRLALITLPPITLLYSGIQTLIESKESEIFSRPLQIEQLVGTAVGLGVGYCSLVVINQLTGKFFPTEQQQLEQ